MHAGVAQHELGEVRLRLGDLEGAEEAFGRAQELGEDPQPGLALLRLAQGDPSAAVASIGRSLEGAAFDGFARARMLSAQAEIARAAADAERATDARTNSARSPGSSPLPRCARRADGRTDWSRCWRTIPEPHPCICAETRDRWSAASAPYETAKAEVALAEAELLRGDGTPPRPSSDARAPRSNGSARSWTLVGRRTWRSGSSTAGSPSRTVRTFLFTDIVGSTSLIEVIGDDAWDDLRRWHDQTLRASFVDHGGEEIDHAGDGFFVAFADVDPALASAVEIQRLLAEHRRAHGFAPQVRMGIHATTATHDGSDYTGLGVHTAARISALAGAGEILASAETLAEVPDVRSSERRTAQLKGIAEPVDVIAVEWRD